MMDRLAPSCYVGQHVFFLKSSEGTPGATNMGDIAALAPGLGVDGGSQNLGSEQQGRKEGLVGAVHVVGCRGEVGR